MRVLVAGGRDFDNRDLLFEVLDSHFLQQDVTIISGRAKGADTLGYVWAKENGKKIESFKAEWDKHGRPAGMIRNQTMLDSGIDVAVITTGGPGTANMRSLCVKAGVKIIDVEG